VLPVGVQCWVKKKHIGYEISSYLSTACGHKLHPTGHFIEYLHYVTCIIYSIKSLGVGYSMASFVSWKFEKLAKFHVLIFPVFTGPNHILSSFLNYNQLYLCTPCIYILTEWKISLAELYCNHSVKLAVIRPS